MSRKNPFLTSVLALSSSASVLGQATPPKPLPLEPVPVTDNCSVDGAPPRYSVLDGPLVVQAKPPQETTGPLTIPEQPLAVLPLPSFTPQLTLDSVFPINDLILRFDLEHYKQKVGVFEGDVHHAYKDIAKIVTIGKGFNMDKAGNDDFVGEYTNHGMKFLNLSSRELWRLANIPDDFDEIHASVRLPIARRKSVSDESIARLFDVSIREAVYSAAVLFGKDNFNAASAERQMAMVDVAYNIGKNLLKPQHAAFLEAANSESGPDWTRMSNELYSSGYHHTYRAIDVLKAFDPDGNYSLSHSGKHTSKHSAHKTPGSNESQLAKLEAPASGHAHAARQRHAHHRGHKTVG